MKLITPFQVASRWFFETPQRALDRAYQAALKVKDIEDKHFQGRPVAREFSDYGETTLSYFKTEVRGYLQKIDINLAEFKASRFFLNLSDLKDSSLPPEVVGEEFDGSNRFYSVLKKLEFIDRVVSRYKAKKVNNKPPNLSDVTPSKIARNSRDLALEMNGIPGGKGRVDSQKDTDISQTKSSTTSNTEDVDLESVTGKTGVLPRSFMRTISRIKQEIDPKSELTEEQVIQNYRQSRYKTAISIKFVLLLIIVPILTHQLTKTIFLNSPLRDFFLGAEVVFINEDYKREALEELRTYEETLHFERFIESYPKLSEEEIEARMQARAEEISQQYHVMGIDAIANIFSDIFSLAAFAAVIFFSRKEIEVVKSFLDGIFYDLSDSAKAFLIILFTDMFVGFHSPHGWEVILEGISRHFGLPENRDFNFLFIATFPVILDTVLKYWIFRYLNRISPSAVATYRNMNE